MNNRIIITGGPGFGKTSIISELASRGYSVSHEKAREVIKEQMDLGSDFLPWLDVSSFSKYVVEKIMTEKLNDGSLMFFDRGIPDVLGYLKNALIDFDELFYTEGVKKMNYAKKVFFVPPWESIYVTDNQRKETYQQALSISNHIKGVYIELGYQLVDIPIGSVEFRTDFIISELPSPQF